jgi:hypothetical protein
MRINDGSRPSALRIAQHQTGELPLSAEELDKAGPTLAALEAEKERVPAFDWTLLSAAAHRLEEPRTPVAAPRRSWLWGLFPALAMVLALVFLRFPGEGNRLKGEVDLGFYLLREGQVLPGDPDGPVRADDRIQFTYHAATYDRLVLLSLDGRGQLTVFYPETGEQPQPVIPGETHVLEGSIRLDDAPGPETFVAFYGVDSVSEARERALAAWKEEGIAGLRALAEESPDVALLVLERR